MTNIIPIIALSFVAGVFSVIVISKTIIYIWKPYENLRELRARMIELFHDANLDQAYIFLVKKDDYRSICWARESLDTWDRIKAFESSIFMGLQNGTIKNPYSDDRKLTIMGIDQSE